MATNSIGHADASREDDRPHEGQPDRDALTRHGVGDEAGDHEHRALGEVDHPRRREHEVVAHGDERQHRPDRQGRHDDLHEICHVTATASSGSCTPCRGCRRRAWCTGCRSPA